MRGLLLGPRKESPAKPERFNPAPLEGHAGALALPVDHGPVRLRTRDPGVGRRRYVPLFTDGGR